MISEVKITTPTTIGTAANPGTELLPSRIAAAIQAATTSTPIQPLIAHAGRSWITTRVPECPTGVASGSAVLLDVLTHGSSSLSVET